jgi:hypothetical protein
LELKQDLQLLRDTYVKFTRSKLDPAIHLLTTSNLNSVATSLTEQSVQLLHHLAFIDPALAHAIVSTLLSCDSITVEPTQAVSSPTDNILLRDRIFDVYLNVMKKNLETGKTSDAVHFIRYFSVFHLYRDHVAGESKFDQLLRELAQLTVQEHRNRLEDPNSTENLRSEIYESFLASNDTNMVNKYVQLEDEAWLNVSISHFYDEKFLSNDQYPFVELFFRPIMNYARAAKKHLHESIVDECIQAISSGNFAQLQIIMEPPMMRRLRPLILLLCWDRYKTDINKRREMIRVLWPHKWVSIFASNTNSHSMNQQNMRKSVTSLFLMLVTNYLFNYKRRMHLHLISM